MDPTVKHVVDGTAVGTALLSYFQLIPWTEIAGFLSSIWLIITILSWIVTTAYPFVRKLFKK